MKCLCCGKELLGSSSPEEIVNKWHNSCVKKFFGVTKFPEISIDDKVLFEIAKDSVNKGLTIPGVQKKLSLYTLYYFLILHVPLDINLFFSFQLQKISFLHFFLFLY